MTTHRLITPWPISADGRFWCGLSFAQASADRVALEPAAVTCEHCAAAMRSALLQLSVDVPRLPPEVGS